LQDISFNQKYTSLQTNRERDRRQYHANSRSYCVQQYGRLKTTTSDDDDKKLSPERERATHTMAVSNACKKDEVISGNAKTRTESFP